MVGQLVEKKRRDETLKRVVPRVGSGRRIMSLSTAPMLAAAASNDLEGIRYLVEHEAVPLDLHGDWCVTEDRRTCSRLCWF